MPKHAMAVLRGFLEPFGLSGRVQPGDLLLGGYLSHTPERCKTEIRRHKTQLAHDSV
jgi:hypothetical protein